MTENKKALKDESSVPINIITQVNTDNNGYFKTHRALFNNVIWLNSTPEQKVVLFTILSKANWNDNSWEWQGEKYQCKPGEFISSYAKIAKAACKGISTQNVRTALKRFKKLDFLTVQSTGGYQDGIKVIINNWAIYQAGVNRPTNRPLTDIQQTPNSFLTTIEEYKNNINDIIDISENKKFKKPTLIEVQNYISEIGSNVDANQFMDFYSANGWKVGKNPMKDWKATLRGWDRRNNKSTNSNKQEGEEYVYNPYL